MSLNKFITSFNIVPGINRSSQTAFNRNVISSGLSCKGFLISPLRNGLRFVEKDLGQKKGLAQRKDFINCLTFFFRGGFQGLPLCTKGRRMGLTKYSSVV